MQIQKDIAHRIAEERKIPYFEASAKDSINVDSAFKTLLTNIINSSDLHDKVTQADS